MFRDLGFVSHLMSVPSSSIDAILRESICVLCFCSQCLCKRPLVSPLWVSKVSFFQELLKSKGKKDSGGLLNAWGGGGRKERRQEKHREARSSAFKGQVNQRSGAGLLTEQDEGQHCRLSLWHVALTKSPEKGLSSRDGEEEGEQP